MHHATPVPPLARLVVRLALSLDGRIPLPGRLRDLYRRDEDLPALTFLSGIWTAMVIAVNPVGNFPLNDDWALGMAVKDLVEKHQVRFPPWFAGSFIAQMFLGAFVCLPFGFSFTVLRGLSIVLGLVAVLAVYVLARQAGADRLLGCWAALTLAVNPLVLQNANTFMTDVPFLAFLLVALVFVVRASRAPTPRNVGVALVATAVATLIRQPGTFVPLATLGGMFAARRVTARRLLVVVAAAMVIFSVLACYERWLRSTGQMPSQYGQQGEEIVNLLKDPATFQTKFGGFRGFRDRLEMALIYSGVVLAPLLPLVMLRRRRTTYRINAWASAGAAAFAVAALQDTWGREWSMPFVDGFNLFDLGLGPLTLVDTFLRSRDHIGRAGPRFWWWITSVGCAGGTVIVYVVLSNAATLISESLRGVTRQVDSMAEAVMFALMLGYGFIVACQFGYDRYLIPLFPPLIVVLIARAGAPSVEQVRPAPTAPTAARTALGWAMAGVAVLLLGGFSVAATHDYLAWNRARWKALADLTEVDGVTADRIDGGFEFNGKIRHETTFDFTTTYSPTKSWWWVTDDEYRITFGEMTGYATVRRYPFVSWLPPGLPPIHVLKRTP